MSRVLPRGAAVAACAVAIALWGTTAHGGPSDPRVELPAFEDGPGAMLEQAGPLINLAPAHSKYPSVTGAGYAVAIIDTGVDSSHPALSGRYVGGYDFVNDDADPDDDHVGGHGTHVAGIAVSSDAIYTGVAPAAGFAALKVFDGSGKGGFWSDIQAALQWVIDHRVEHNIVAVNMSLGTSTTYNAPFTHPVVSDELGALKNAGVFIAAASGNDWYAHSPDPPGIAHEGVAYPAADASVVAVGSVCASGFGGYIWSTGAIDNTTAADRVNSFTDRSTTMLDLLAPGSIITSSNNVWEGAGSDWRNLSGTSMATPAVAGLAVLIREAIEENWDPADWPSGSAWQDTILQIMLETGVTVTDGDDEDDNVANLGADFKRIDVLAALDSLIPEPATALLLAAGWVLLPRRRRRSSGPPAQ